jgi:S-adenosylmethionine uptake transporter
MEENGTEDTGTGVFGDVLFCLGSWCEQERDIAMTQTTLSRRGTAFQGAAFMIAAGLLFAIDNTLVQMLTMTHGQASTTVAFWQYFIAALFSIPWVLARLKGTLMTKRWGLQILRVVLAAAGVQLWVLGLAHVPIWQAIALIMTSPFFVTIGANMMLGEPVRGDRWLAVFVGFIGGMIILSPWNDSFSIWALMPVGAAFLWAMSSLVTKVLTRTETPDSLTLYLLVLLTPINAALAVGSGFAITVDVAVWLIVLTGVLTAAANFALVKAYSLADAAYLQPFDHVKLPFNLLFGWMVFSYLPAGEMWIGTALIVGASVFLLNREARAGAAQAA